MPVFLGNSAVSFYRGTTAINLFLGATPLNPEIPDLDVLVAAGMNYASPSYYSIEFPFRDLMRKCNTWRAENVDGEGYFDHPLPPMSPEGYPLEMPSGGSTFLDLIVTNHWNESVLGNTLRITFDGDATVAMTWPCQTTQVNSNEYTVITNGATALTLRVNSINPANPIRNLKIETSDPAEFRQAFLDRQDGMRVMRFMDWMNTNFSPIETFGEWPTEDDFPSVGGYNRVPISVMCRAANATHIPPWFCIPHLADDDFVEQFAYEVTRHIDPTLPIYFEYSNECWNSMFGQYQYCVDQGVALGLPGANQYEQGAQFYGLRSRQIEEILRPILGERLKMVFAWQAVNPYFGSVGLDYNDTAAHMDVLAIAPYFGSSLGDFDYPEGNPHSQQVKDGGLPFVFSYLEDNIDNYLRGFVAEWAEMAATHGCEIACYEAGQHLVGNGPANDDLVLRNIFIAANRDPRMGDMYKLFASMWSEETPEGSIIAWYNSMWEPVASGFWGAMENEADINAVKWLAIRDVLDDSEVTYPDYPPFPEIPEPPSPIVRADNPRMALLGPSTAQRNTIAQPNTPANYGFGPAGPYMWAMRTGLKFDHRIQYTNSSTVPYFTGDNFGQEDAGFPQILNRCNAAVTAFSGITNKWVSLAPGRNEIQNGTVTRSQYMANVQECVNRLVAGGFTQGTNKIILEGLWKKHTNHASWPAGSAQRTLTDQVNADMAAYAAAVPGVIFVDMQTGMIDPNGSNGNPYLSDTVSDVTHYSQQGAQRAGRILRDALAPYLVQYAYPARTSGNRYPEFTGTGGTRANGATGTVFSGYEVARENAANTATVVASIENGAQRITVTNMGSVPNLTEAAHFRLASNGTVAHNVPANTMIGQRVRVRIPATTAPYSLAVRMTDTGSTGRQGMAIATPFGTATSSSVTQAAPVTSGQLPVLYCDGSTEQDLWLETPLVPAITGGGCRPAVILRYGPSTGTTLVMDIIDIQTFIA